MVETLVKETKQKTKKVEIPKYLIREEIDGIPYYYKGYQAVLDKEKTLEEIMGSSTLQSVIVQVMMKFLFQAFDLKDYWILTNEVGGHLKKGVNLSFDIAIFDRTVLTTDKINKHYANVPAKIVFEVDVKIEDKKHSDIYYVSQKTEKLLEFGVEQVIWILTETKKIIVATPENNWQIMKWTDVITINNHNFQFSELLAEVGLK